MTANSASPATRRAALLVLAVYAVTLALLLVHHEMWRDELQAWTLARDSNSLGELWRNTRYEGHPLLWHLLLYPLAHIGAPPEAMQAVNWAISVAAAAVLLLGAPFPLWVSGALAFSYFPLYEYGAISRNYALTMLAVWLVCLALARCSRWGAAGAAALAANASAMGFLLAPAVAAALLLGPAGARRLRASFGPLALVVGGAALGAAQMLPPPDYEHARAWCLSWQPMRIDYLARGYARALLPLPHPGLHFWNTSALFPWPLPPGAWGWVSGLAGLLVVGAALVLVGWVVRRSAGAAAGWVVGAASLLVFAYVKFPGAARHQGFLWIWGVATLWVAVSERSLPSRTAIALLAPSLVFGLAASVVAARREWRAPFSGARCAARQLERQNLASLPLVGGVDFASSGVAAFLPHGRLFYPASRAEGSFVVWNLARTRQDRLLIGDIVHEAVDRDQGDGVVLLLNAPLDEAFADSCQEVFHCAPTIVPDESLWGYRCRAAQSRRAASTGKVGAENGAP